MATQKKRKSSEAAALQKGRKLQAKSTSRADEDEAERDEDIKSLKKKKKKKKPKGMPLGLLIGVGAGVLVLLIVVGAGAAYYFTRPAPAAPAQPKQVAQNPDKKDDKQAPPAPLPPPPVPQPGIRVVPGIKEGNPVKAGGDGIVRNVRGAGYRTERRSELKQIGTAFVAFCDTHKGANRTLENFLKDINNFAHIRDSVKDGYYTVNMKADPTSSTSIIAYETAVDQGRHMCVMGDTSVDYVPQQAVKDATK